MQYTPRAVSRDDGRHRGSHAHQQLRVIAECRGSRGPYPAFDESELAKRRALAQLCQRDELARVLVGRGDLDRAAPHDVEGVRLLPFLEDRRACRQLLQCHVPADVARQVLVVEGAEEAEVLVLCHQHVDHAVVPQQWRPLQDLYHRVHS